MSRWSASTRCIANISPKQMIQNFRVRRSPQYTAGPAAFASFAGAEGRDSGGASRCSGGISRSWVCAVMDMTSVVSSKEGYDCSAESKWAAAARGQRLRICAQPVRERQTDGNFGTIRSGEVRWPARAGPRDFRSHLCTAEWKPAWPQLLCGSESGLCGSVTAPLVRTF